MFAVLQLCVAKYFCKKVWFAPLQLFKENWKNSTETEIFTSVFCREEGTLKFVKLEASLCGAWARATDMKAEKAGYGPYKSGWGCTRAVKYFKKKITEDLQGNVVVAIGNSNFCAQNVGKKDIYKRDSFRRICFNKSSYRLFSMSYCDHMCVRMTGARAIRGSKDRRYLVGIVWGERGANPK